MNRSKYITIIKTLKSVFDTPSPLSIQAKMSLSASILGSNFPNWNFCGFYMATTKHTLEIGPYYGHIIPCTNIKFGKGVCGTAAEKKKTIIVNNVLRFDNYISCDSETKSEIVVPVFERKKLKAVLDIDSIKKDDFNNIDRTYLEKICKLISNKKIA